MQRPESRDLPSPRTFPFLCRDRRRIDPEVYAKQPQLVTLEVGDRHAAPALRAADERGAHELHRRALVAKARDHLRPTTLLLEASLDEVGRPAEDAVPGRQTLVPEQRVQ